MTIWADPRDVAVRLADLPRMTPPRRVVMADPRDFDVAYAINPHMLDAEGALRRVDRERAREQWRALRETFAKFQLDVTVIDPLDGHPDVVFCANPMLPVPARLSRSGRRFAIASNMRWRERRREVPHMAAALRRLGYPTRTLRTTARFEGMGDGLWHPGRALLWAGVGPRSSERAWTAVAELVAAPVVTLRLIDPDFYHLDTVLALLDEQTCLWRPDALDARSRRLVERLVPRRIEADPREARELLACNALSPDGRRVVLQRGCVNTVEWLTRAGYETVEVDTGEFLKSGGSVFCLKLLVW